MTSALPVHVRTQGELTSIPSVSLQFSPYAKAKATPIHFAGFEEATKLAPHVLVLKANSELFIKELPLYSEALIPNFKVVPQKPSPLFKLNIAEYRLQGLVS